MKKILTLFLTLTMFGCLTLSVSAGFNRSYTAPFGSPTVDGEVDDVWEGAEWTAVDKPHDGVDSSDTDVRAKLLWDDTNLYFLAEIVDKSINADQDIMEIYIDENKCKGASYGSDDSHTRFKIVGGLLNDGANSKSDSIFEVTELENDTYIMEGSLRWTNGAPAVGTEMGLEFMYNDASETVIFVEAYRWNADTAGGDIAPSKSPASFGTLILADAVEPVVDAAGAGLSTSGIIGIVVAAVAVIAVAVVIVRKKKK